MSDTYERLGEARYTELAIEAQDYAHEDAGTIDETVEVMALGAGPSWYVCCRHEAVGHAECVDVAERYPEPADEPMHYEYLRLRKADRTHDEALAIMRPSLAEVSRRA